ncbi:MAG: LamG-like jellyroll fold domain-containing protein [Fidelibacterota bacterium]
MLFITRNSFWLRSLPIFCLLLSTKPAQNLALYLDGDGDYINLPTIIINSPTFTIEAWARMEGLGGGNKTSNPIFQQRDDIPGDYHSAIILYAERYEPNQTSTFWVRSNNNPANFVEYPHPNYGEWHHYAGVCDQNRIYLYIDGMLVDSTLNTQSGNYTTSIDYIDIGRHRFNLLDQGFFYGYLDEIKIWNTARTQSEIFADMELSPTGFEANLLAYWNFQDGMANDATPNGNNGTLMGNANVVPLELPILCQIPGDVNADNMVDIFDILTVADHVLGQATDTFQWFCADCNQDGIINIIDIICILQIIFNPGLN